MSNLLVMRRPETLSPMPKFGIGTTRSTTAGQPYLNINLYDGELNYYGNLVTSTSYSNHQSSWMDAVRLPSSNEGFYGHHCSANGWTGHIYQSIGPGMSGSTPPGNVSILSTIYDGIWIDYEGVRSDIYVAALNNELRIQSRGGSRFFIERLSSLVSTSAVITSPGTNTNFRGSVCYNKRIKTLTFLEPTNTSGNYRYHIWTNPAKDLTGVPGELYEFMRSAKSGENGATYSFTDFTWTTNITNGDLESYARIAVVHGDNGLVGLVRNTPNVGKRFSVYNPSTNTVIDTSLLTSSSVTYGNSTYYTQNWNITWDNSCVAVYSQHYYYGAGIHVHFINTNDPSKYSRFSQFDTSAGWSLLPASSSSFIAGYGGNIDGNNGVDLRMFTQNISNYNQLSTGQEAPTSSVRIDGAYTTTNYPLFITCDTWGD